MKATKLTFGKYIVLSFLGLGLAVSSCKKDEPTTEPEPEPAAATFSAHVQAQVPIVLKETGELCPPCGGWGWTAWETVVNDLKGKAFLWSQYSDYFVSNSHFVNQEIDPANSVQNAFQANFPYGGSKPLWYVNGTESSSSSASITDANNSIATPTASVNVSAAYKIQWDGDKLTVDAQAKLYNNMTGTYHMGVYLVEDKAKGTQSGHPSSSADLEHKVVMRGSVGGGIWGEEIISGTASAGDIIEKSYSVTVPSSYIKSNLSIGVIIWKKNGAKYFYENAATNQTK